MPIVFAPPQPVAPGISEAYGRAQMEAQATPTLANLYAEAGRNRQAAAIAEANRFAENNRVGASLGERAQEHADELQFRKDAFHASQGANARDVFAAQVGEAQNLQHAQLNAWVHQQDMTYADELALKRMQMSVSEVEQAYRNNEVTKEDRDAMLLQLRTHIDPYKQRQEKALAQMQESHAKAYEEQAARQTKISLMNAQLDSKTLAERTRTIVDPFISAQVERDMPGATPQQIEQEAIRRGGYAQWVQVGFDQFGHPQWKQVEHASQAKGAKGAADGLSEEQYLKHRLEVIKSVDAWAAKRDAEAAKTGGAQLTPEQRLENYKSAMDAAGLGQTYQQHRSERGGPTQAGGPEGPGSGQIPAADTSLKPFDEDSQASPKQKAILDLANAKIQNIQKLPIPPEIKDDYGRAVRLSLSMLREYGRIDAEAMSKMSEKDREALTLAGKTIDRIEGMTFGGQPQPGWFQRRFNNYQPATGGGGGF